MKKDFPDLNHELMLDGNSAAGMLFDIFGVEMTAAPTECAHCGNEDEMGTLLAFTRGPGIVLRCSACEQVVLRIVKTSDSVLLDARGAVYLRIMNPKPLPEGIPGENDSLGG
jgi:hypothetical protein